MNDLRWAVGCILSEGEEEVDKDLRNLFLEKEFKLFNLPEVSNVVKSSFPHNTFLSIFIGIYRVYPLMGSYIKVNIRLTFRYKDP